MEATASLNSIPMSVRKMRLVVDLIRGKRVGEALGILEYSKQEAAIWLRKNLLSAIANWEYKTDGLESADEYDLIVSEIFADAGAQIKRFRPAPHGRAHRIRKHSCHITIKVSNTLPIPSEKVEATEPETVEE
ncbi:LSU ribosomal protein L22P [Neolewinella xylanilytica]|uniref:Large ribosomal subunit protein uL22 n=1 Tax=Neolewinella xylanilytica TaxID=1514080 RepID=A0A2S6I2H5_9BACT|nr:50S ribosomal protein L22 [Neolewinella xylanilytica]PPK85368.1 LSU ribosomal protein L22P [Neolewinella xylanilytica]